VILVGLLILAFSAQPALPQQPAQVRYGGTLVVSTPSDPPTLNMGLTVSAPPHIATAAVFDSLLRYDKTMKPVPWLAKSWTVSGDGLRYRFVLRDGVKWHDGKPFSAEDAKFNFETIMRSHPQGKSNFGAIKSVEAPDRSTLIIQLGEQFAPFITFLGPLHAPMAFPKHLYEGKDVATNPINNAPIGTGPFKFVEWRRGDRIVLEKNRDYWVPNQPYLDRIVVRVLPQDSARIQALTTGELNWIPLYFSYPSAQRPPAGVEVTFDGQEGLGPGLNQLWINRNHPALSNLAVRQAIAHAIDKQAIAQTVFFGFAKPAVSILGSGSWAFSSNVPQYAFDRAAASRLLDQAGFPRGADGTRFTVRLLATSVVETATKQAQLTQDNLAAVGIRATLVQGDITVVNTTAFERRDFDLYFAEGALFTGPDPHITAQYYASENIRPAWYTNAGAYRNQEVDRLYARGARIMNREVRKQVYENIQKIVLAELPAIPMWEGGRGHLFSSKFAGIPGDPFLGFRYGYEGIWWKDGRPRP
jgi:peptide/nickel transport system substrate-binding protein